jgi:hypothetical protein
MEQEQERDFLYSERQLAYEHEFGASVADVQLFLAMQLLRSAFSDVHGSYL